MNPKYISIAAVVGFCLSFLIGLVSHVSFVPLLLRALLFGVIFALAAIGISIIFQKFLSVQPSSQLSSDELQGSAAQTQGALGSVVNITVDDDMLPDDSAAPKFSVGKNRSALNRGVIPNSENFAQNPSNEKNESDSFDSSESQTSKESKVDEKSVEVVKKPAFSAAPRNASENSVDGRENVPEEKANEPAEFKPISLGAVVKDAQAAISSTSNLDNLPEIGDLNVEAVKNEEVISDSDFAVSGNSGDYTPSLSTSSSKGGGEIALDQNASVMAQAIRTALAQDD